MTDTLSHRGPDAQGVWTEGSVGLGHRKLEVTPESTADAQPRTWHGGELAITADARIDNRDDLIKTLHLGERLRSPITDSEVILGAYEKWGASCPEHLVGAYAFMIWDAIERRLLCVRDHLGIKPLFYYNGHDHFVAASELKALFASSIVPRRINEERVAEHLVVAPGDAESTFYEDVFHAPPAHVLTVSPNANRRTRYWTLDPEHELRLGSEEAYAEALRAQFLEAVECRLRGPGPVGAALSGGLDSSSIACAAKDTLSGKGRGPLRTFSLVFPSFSGEEKAEIDERDYMDAVLATGGFEPHFIRGNRHSPLEHLGDMLSHMDQAFWAPNLYLHWAMFGAAEENGVRVFLDGLDGDGTISRGFQYLAELVADGDLGAFDRQITALADRYDRSREGLARNHAYPVLRAMATARPLKFMGRAVSVSRQFNIPLREMISGVWLREVLPSWVQERLRGGTDPQATEAGTEQPLIREGVARAFGVTENDLRQTNRNRALLGHRELHAKPFLESTYPTTLSVADKASAAFGIEARYPFFDRRLIELSVSFPASTKLQDGWPRYIFRRAMDGILPEDVQWRRQKARLGANFDRMLAEEDAAAIEALLRRNAPSLSEYVNPESIQAVLSTLRSDASEAPLALYTLAVLAAWLEREMPRKKSGRPKNL
jgi:asparagine synthase (glutamine-hydrolysing)